jgi:ATP-dependent RNA helicase DeaD
MQVAMAAVKLVHEASGAAAGEEEIPDTSPVADRAGRDDRPGKGGGRRPPRPAQTSGARMAKDRFSLVEVPESAAGEVVTALRASTIKGRKATIRLAHESR